MLHTFQKTNQRDKTFIGLYIEVNAATKLLSEALMKAVDCMSFSCCSKKQIANKTWFDNE